MLLTRLFGRREPLRPIPPPPPPVLVRELPPKAQPLEAEVRRTILRHHVGGLLFDLRPYARHREAPAADFLPYLKRLFPAASVGIEELRAVCEEDDKLRGRDERWVER